MSEASTRRNPIPQPKADDHEDVSWALSTAEATWSRGDRADALKWLRRAAEAASEAEADDRALELAKAAAEIATNLEDAAKDGGAQSIPISMSTEVPAGSVVSSPILAVTSPAFVPHRPPQKPAQKPPLPKAASKPEPQKPKAPANPAQNKPIPKPAGLGPSAPRVQAKLILAPPSETSNPDLVPSPANSTGQLPAQALSDTDDTMFRERPHPAVDIDDTGPITPRSKRVTGNPTAPVESSDDMEAWPTQSLSSGELASYDGGEQTRIGTPAYREPEDPSVRQPIALRGIRTSQAVRVVVWRSADGVHVAPHGTTVTAISVDAMLVALDPSADLSAWLGGDKR
ncbi:MAG: hypothetical protein ABI461_19270 [Polyangiaceae bacterium]